MGLGLLRPVYHELEEDSRERGIKSFERNTDYERFSLWLNKVTKLRNKNYQKRRNEACLKYGNHFWGNYDRKAANGTYKSTKARTSKEHVKAVSFMSELA